MRFSIRPTFNPSGRYARADFIGEHGDSGSLSLRFGFAATTAVEEEFCRAIEDGFSTYAADALEDFGPLPSGVVTVERIDFHSESSDAEAFRIVGAFAAREFHKLTHANSR